LDTRHRGMDRSISAESLNRGEVILRRR